MIAFYRVLSKDCLAYDSNTGTAELLPALVATNGCLIQQP